MQRVLSAELVFSSCISKDSRQIYAFSHHHSSGSVLDVKSPEKIAVCVH